MVVGAKASQCSLSRPLRSAVCLLSVMVDGGLLIVGWSCGYRACACVCGILEADLAETNISKRFGCVGWPNPLASVAVLCLCFCFTAVYLVSFPVSCVFADGGCVACRLVIMVVAGTATGVLDAGSSNCSSLMLAVRLAVWLGYLHGRLNSQ